jgi:putative hydrolase of the HAD superfamily
MIKNLIFDCGGVVFDVDYSLSLMAFKKLASDPSLFDSISVNQFKHIASEFETGKQTIDEFYENIREKYYLKATNNEIKIAWNSMLLDFVPDSLEHISKLKHKFTVSLFSNTNELHYIEFEPICRKLLETFEYVLKSAGFKPEETVFIDDSEENVLAASKLGIIPFHYTKDWNLEKLFNHFNSK